MLMYTQPSAPTQGRMPALRSACCRRRFFRFFTHPFFVRSQKRFLEGFMHHVMYTKRKWRNQRNEADFIFVQRNQGWCTWKQWESESIVRQLSSCFFCRYHHLVSCFALSFLRRLSDFWIPFQHPTTMASFFSRNEIYQQKPVILIVNGEMDPPTQALNTWKRAMAQSGVSSSAAQHHTFFFFFFRFCCLHSHVTDHTDTYRFFSHTMSFISWGDSVEQSLPDLSFIRDPAGANFSVSLTWICTHELIFVWIGNLSAAWVLKMSTHSLSGAKHRRQQAFPAFCAITRDPDLSNNFFFFTELSCRGRKIILVNSLWSHTFPDEALGKSSLQFGFAFQELAMGFFEREREKIERSDGASPIEKDLQSSGCYSMRWRVFEKPKFPLCPGKLLLKKYLQGGPSPFYDEESELKWQKMSEKVFKTRSVEHGAWTIGSFSLKCAERSFRERNFYSKRPNRLSFLRPINFNVSGFNAKPFSHTYRRRHKEWVRGKQAQEVLFSTFQSQTLPLRWRAKTRLKLSLVCASSFQAGSDFFDYVMMMHDDDCMFELAFCRVLGRLGAGVITQRSCVFCGTRFLGMLFGRSSKATSRTNSLS